MKKTYHGSCECEAVKVEATFDLSAGSFKCNCRMCSKSRFWGASVEPNELKLISGKEFITTYWTTPIHHFCKVCGVKVFARGTSPDGEFAVIALAALDDLDPKELAAVPVFVCNGREDKFQEEAPFKGHL